MSVTNVEVLHCRVPEEIADAVKEIAKKERRPISNVLYNFIEDELKRRLVVEKGN
jgi:predicted transcriptional regulator